MAATAGSQEPTNYFTLPRRGAYASSNISTPSFILDQSSDSDINFRSLQARGPLEKTTRKPGSLPMVYSQYSLDPALTVTDDIKQDPELGSLFSSNSFEDWKRWDDEESNLLSPLIEPFSSTLKLEPSILDKAILDSKSPNMKEMDIEDDAQQKRKSSDYSSTSPPPTSRHVPPQKTSHNMIEKRYRTKLNDKIVALRDSVPSLRVAAEAASASKSRSSYSSSNPLPVTPQSQDYSLSNANQELSEDSGAPNQKLNKATVLSKATEYIAHLEKKSTVLAKENTHLKARVNAFETLLMGNSDDEKPIYESGDSAESAGYANRTLPPSQQDPRKQRR